MKEKLLIIGASGHGKVVADIALSMKRWKYIAFLDDNENLKTSLGLEVIGSSNDIDKYIQDYDVFVGIGNNSIRKQIQEKLESKSASIPTLIHPNATIAREVEIDVGTVIMAGAIINCSTTIGKGSIINTGATIDHDNVIRKFVHISPGAHLAGTVEVGSNTWVGIGTIISNNLSITDDCIIGAGAVVIENIVKQGLYVGVPVRRVDK